MVVTKSSWTIDHESVADTNADQSNSTQSPNADAESNTDADETKNAETKGEEDSGMKGIELIDEGQDNYLLLYPECTVRHIKKLFSFFVWSKNNVQIKTNHPPTCRWNPTYDVFTCLLVEATARPRESFLFDDGSGDGEWSRGDRRNWLGGTGERQERVGVQGAGNAVSRSWGG
jgi:hypothetical protein